MLFVLTNGEFTKKIIRGGKRRITRRTLFRISHTGEAVIGGQSGAEPDVRGDEIVYTPIPVPPKYKNWGEAPTVGHDGERGIMNSIVQWTEISHTGSGKIGYGSNIL